MKNKLIFAFFLCFAGLNFNLQSTDHYRRLIFRTILNIYKMAYESKRYGSIDSFLYKLFNLKLEASEIGPDLVEEIVKFEIEVMSKETE